MFVEHERDDSKPKTQVGWVARETPEQELVPYYRFVQAKAKAVRKAMAFRRGGGKCYGILGEAQTGEGYTAWVMHKTPKWWGPPEVIKFLKAQDWALREATISPPRSQSQGWVVTALPPLADRDAETVEFSGIAGAERQEIVLRRWKKRAPQVSIEAKPDAQGWRRPKPEAAVVAAKVDVDMETKAATEGGTDTAHRDKTRRIETPKTGPNDLELWDLGGSGDCGFRCLGAIMATFKGKEKANIMAKIAPLSKNMRAKIYNQLKEDTAWKAGWALAPEETKETAGGDLPKSAEEWHEAMNDREKMWLDWRMCAAAADAVKRIIVIFEQSDNLWVQRARFKPTVTPSSNEVIPLLLDKWGQQTKHFKTCIRGAEGFPPAWAKTRELPTWSGQGGAKGDEEQEKEKEETPPEEPQEEYDSWGGWEGAYAHLEASYSEPKTPSDQALRNWPGHENPAEEEGRSLPSPWSEFGLASPRVHKEDRAVEEAAQALEEAWEQREEAEVEIIKACMQEQEERRKEYGKDLKRQRVARGRKESYGPREEEEPTPSRASEGSRRAKAAAAAKPIAATRAPRNPHP